MHRSMFEDRGLVLVVIPDPADSNWVIPELEQSGFTINTATHKNLVETARRTQPQLILLESDKDKGAPDPIPLINKLAAIEWSQNIVIMLIITETQAFDFVPYYSEWAANNVIVGAFVRTPHIKGRTDLASLFSHPNGLVNHLDALVDRSPKSKRDLHPFPDHSES